MIRIYSWHDGKVQSSSDGAKLSGMVGSRNTRTWIDLTDPEPGIVKAVARELGLHPLVAEDIVELNERAKVVLIGEAIHVIAFVLDREEASPTNPDAPGVQAHEIDLVLGRNFLLTVHPGAWDPTKAHQLRMGLEPILARGADFLMWALVDSIVDGYFPVFDRIGDDIDLVQDRAIERPTPETLQHVFRLKRELIHIRHVLAPSREVFAQLTSREFKFIAEANVFYFRGVYDHLIRLNEELDSFRELVAGSLDIYLSTINNNLSTIMKRLTGVTVILAGIGGVGGLFGMSEAAAAVAGTQGSGFYAILGGTIAAAAAAWVMLRRINWL